MIYLQNWKQLLSVGLFYNIKVIDNTVRHHEEFSNVFFVESFVFIIMVQAEFYSVNCPLLPLSPVNCPCHLRNESFLSREGDVHVHAPPNYGRSLKWRKTVNEMGGNIPSGNFLGGNFPGGGGGIFYGVVWWARIFRVGILPGGIFLEPINISN